MIINLYLDGTAKIVAPERVFRGSNNVNEIVVIAPFGNTTAFEISFQLPSGILSNYIPMYFISSIKDGIIGAWGYKLPESITAEAGAVGVAINAVYTDGNRTSFKCYFDVENSNLPELPLYPEVDVYQLLLQYYQQNAANIEALQTAFATIPQQVADEFDSALVALMASFKEIVSKEPNNTYILWRGANATLKVLGTMAFETININWGDGTQQEETLVNGTNVITKNEPYPKEGNYIITITGAFDGFNVDNGTDKEKYLKVHLGHQVSSGYNAFNGCNFLEKVTFSPYWNFNTINQGFIQDCLKVRHINLPLLVGTINNSAFRGCGLKEIFIHEGLTIIGLNAFRDCKLTKITLPSSLGGILANAFTGSKLIEIVYNGTKANWDDVSMRADSFTGVTAHIIAKGGNFKDQFKLSGGTLILQNEPNKIEEIRLNNVPLEINNKVVNIPLVDTASSSFNDAAYSNATEKITLTKVNESTKELQLDISPKIDAHNDSVYSHSDIRGLIAFLTGNVNASFKSVSYNAENGHLTFTKNNNTTEFVDLPLELIVKPEDSYYDENLKELILVLADGTEIGIPVGALVNEYYADNVTLEKYTDTADGNKRKFRIKTDYLKAGNIAYGESTVEAELEKIQSEKGLKKFTAISTATNKTITKDDTGFIAITTDEEIVELNLTVAANADIPIGFEVEIINFSNAVNKIIAETGVNLGESIDNQEISYPEFEIQGLGTIIRLIKVNATDWLLSRGLGGRTGEDGRRGSIWAYTSIPLTNTTPVMMSLGTDIAPSGYILQDNDLLLSSSGYLYRMYNVELFTEPEPFYNFWIEYLLNIPILTEEQANKINEMPGPPVIFEVAPTIADNNYKKGQIWVKYTPAEIVQVTVYTLANFAESIPVWIRISNKIPISSFNAPTVSDSSFDAGQLWYYTVGENTQIYIKINQTGTAKWQRLLTSLDIEDSLTSPATDKALSANQGKRLQDNKVDKVEGKSLSTNDYTNTDKQRVDLIQSNTLPPNVVQQNSTHRFVADTEKTTWNGKIDITAIAGLFKAVSYNDTNGHLTFTKHDDSTTFVDLPLELIVTSGYYDALTKEIVLVLASSTVENPQEIRIETQELFNEYFADGVTIEKYVDAADNNKIKFRLTTAYKNAIDGIPTDIKQLADSDNLLFDKSYDSLTNKPTLFSGSYNDLTDKPSLLGVSSTDITIETTDWSSNEYTETVSGVTVSSNLLISLKITNSADVETLREERAKVYKAVAGTGEITFYATEIPTEDLTFSVVVV